MLKITLVKSPIGYKENQKRTLRALGLRKVNQSVTQAPSPQVLGMVRTVEHLVSVEEVDNETA